MRRILQILTSLIFLVCVSQSANAQPVASQVCTSDDSTTFTSTIPYPEKTADIYIRAGRSEDAVQGKLYYQILFDDTASDSASDCVQFGQIQLSTSWQPIGRLPQSSGAPSIRLVLKVDRTSDSLAGASAPMLLLAEESLPCQLINECVVNYAGENFTVLPTTLSYSTDSLQIVQLFTPADDDVRKVIYSVDGHQVYLTPGLEPFNMGYVGIGKHTIGRTVVFESGQSLYDSRNVENDFSLKQMFSAIYYQNRHLVNTFGLLIVALLAWQLGIWLLRMQSHRRQWRRNHGLESVTSKAKKSDRSAGARPNAEFEVSIVDQLWRHKKAVLVVIAGGALIILINTIVVTRFRVEGVSMEPTLSNGSDQKVLLLPAKIADFTGSAFIPDRGSVVVLKRSEYPALVSQLIDTQTFVVKRVIGLPNERVVISGGVITIYNSDNPDGFVPDDVFKWTSNIQGSEGFRIDVVLQDNELFVVGDNRSQSVDSRYYGPVHSN